MIVLFSTIYLTFFISIIVYINYFALNYIKIRIISKFNNADFVFFDFHNTYDSVSFIFKSKN